jgi:hypothetical protein
MGIPSKVGPAVVVLLVAASPAVARGRPYEVKDGPTDIFFARLAPGEENDD